MTTNGGVPAGWYDDGNGALRYWDGATWTEHVHVPTPAAPPQAARPTETPAQIAARYLPPGKTYAPVPDPGPKKAKPIYRRPVFLVAVLLVVVIVLFVALH